MTGDEWLKGKSGGERRDCLDPCRSGLRDKDLNAIVNLGDDPRKEQESGEFNRNGKAGVLARQLAL